MLFRFGVLCSENIAMTFVLDCVLARFLIHFGLPNLPELFSDLPDKEGNEAAWRGRFRGWAVLPSDAEKAFFALVGSIGLFVGPKENAGWSRGGKGGGVSLERNWRRALVKSDDGGVGIPKVCGDDAELGCPGAYEEDECECESSTVDVDA